MKNNIINAGNFLRGLVKLLSFLWFTNTSVLQKVMIKCLDRSVLQIRPGKCSYIAMYICGAHTFVSCTRLLATYLCASFYFC